MQYTSISGLKELVEALNTLPLKIERNIMRAALRQGANVVAREARQNVSVRYGNLKRSIRTGTNKTPTGVEGYVKAGGRKGGGKKEKSAFYAKFIEFGAAAHTIKAGKNKNLLVFIPKGMGLVGKKVMTYSVNHPGTTAKPFLRPAMDARSSEAVAAIASKIRERLNDRDIKQMAREVSE